MKRPESVDAIPAMFKHVASIYEQIRNPEHCLVTIQKTVLSRSPSKRIHVRCAPSCQVRPIESREGIDLALGEEAGEAGRARQLGHHHLLVFGFRDFCFGFANSEATKANFD